MWTGVVCRLTESRAGLWDNRSEQVVGKFELRKRKPVLVGLPEIKFIDDKAGKPVGSQQHISRRPIPAFGNSDGDLQMLQGTVAGTFEQGDKSCGNHVGSTEC